MTTTAPSIVAPPARLGLIASHLRSAVQAAVSASPSLSANTMAWVEKLRRFASLHRQRLRGVARRRFGVEAEAQIAWMAHLLLDAAVRYPERGAAPVDAATLSGALYCLDALPRREAGPFAAADQAVGALRDWVATEEQPPVRPALGRTFAYRPGRWRDEAAGATPVVILAPTPVSLNALAVLELCRRLHVPVAAVVVRRFTVRRCRSEWRRHGPRLLNRIRRKLLLRSDEHPDPVDASLRMLVRRLDPGTQSLRRLARAMRVPIRSVDAFRDFADDPALIGGRIGLFTGGGILSARLLAAFEPGVVNVHTGHLPHYRGMDGVPAAVLEGRPSGVGLTAHYMTAEIDAGEVLTRCTLEPAPYPTAGALENALASLMPLLLVDAALGVASGRLRPVAQPAGGRRYYAMHPRLRPVVDACLASRHVRMQPERPSPARRTLDAVCADVL